MNTRGSITILVILFATISIMILGSLAATAAIHFRGWHRQEEGDRSLAVAEAGINYSRWRLAHAPDDFSNETRTYYDPQGQKVGVYQIDITPPTEGSSILTIKSTGWTSETENIRRMISTRYGLPSFAKYSFLHNANVWFGQGINVLGEIHSNGGIRMDGSNQSLVTSSKNTYTCGSETGCNPPEEKPGVWGSGPDADLWSYPVTNVDFDSVSVDLAQMKLEAQDNGLYFAPSSRQGYHLQFNQDGTVTVSEVRRTRTRDGWSPDNGCEALRQVIRTENTLGTYSLSDNKIIFIEDTTWVDGVVNGITTVVAASFPIDTSSEIIWINDNLTYNQKDGSSALGLIAQQDIYYGLHIPLIFKIDAALMAQKGRIIRHFYNYWWVCSNYPDALRDKLEIYGSVISNQKSYWNYGNPPWSGFTVREINYDPNLKFMPPPYFPTTGEFEIISWNED